MENLIAVFRAVNKDQTKKEGWCWCKKESDSINNCKKKLREDETLSEVWVSKWKESPSVYKMVRDAGGDRLPASDFSSLLRNQHLRANKKPHIKLLPPVTNKQSYQMFTVEIAR